MKAKRVISYPKYSTRQGLDGLVHHYQLIKTHKANGKVRLMAQHQERFDEMHSQTTANARATFEVIKKHVHRLSESPNDYVPEPIAPGTSRYHAPIVKRSVIAFTDEMVNAIKKKYPDGKFSYCAHKVLCEALDVHQ